MFKTISAALLVASIFAAPAMAAGIAKTDVAPATKLQQISSTAPKANALKANSLNTSVLNAKASVRTSQRHHSFHKHFVSAKTHKLNHKVAHNGKAKHDVKRVSAIRSVSTKKS